MRPRLLAAVMILLASGACAGPGVPSAPAARPRSVGLTVPVASPGPPEDALDKNIDAWFAAPTLQTIDATKLPRAECTCDGPGFGRDLQQAVDFADLAVVGHVVSIGPYSKWGTSTTFAVERTIKGPARGTVTFWQAAEVRPEAFPNTDPVTITGHEPAVLMMRPGENFLAPGDRAVLLLRATSDEPGAKYLAADPGSTYPIEDGRVGGAHLLPDVVGSSEQQLVDRITARVGVHPGATAWPPKG